MGQRVSLIIVNHNYGQFLAQAIDSVLMQRCPASEIVVVDDGSTDGSREVIASYGTRVRSLLKENGGMASAVHAAFALTTGDIVMILDADDFLHPNAIRAVVSVWRPDCSKVQYRLSVVDRLGTRLLGVDPPRHVQMPAGDVVPRLAATGRYVTPVTAGNAYSREMLERLLPVPESGAFRNSVDGYLNPTCPFYGDIVSIDEELGYYRIHGENDWAISDGISTERLQRGVTHELAQQQYIEAVATRLGRDWPQDLMLRNSEHVIKRLCSLRLDPTQHAVPTDTIVRLFWTGVRSILRDPNMLTTERMLHLGLLASVAVLPKRRIMSPMGWAYGGRARPAWVWPVAVGLQLQRRRRVTALRKEGGGDTRAYP